MHAFFKLIYKDMLVLVRDRSGLAMLFIMPMALVLIMTSLQDNTFRAIEESGIRLILLNNDQDSLGIYIEQEMMNSQLFQVFTEIDKQVPTESEVKEAVALGKYQIGVIIPSNATENIRRQVKENVALALAGETPGTQSADSVFLTLFLDPTTKTSFRESLQRSIREFSAKIESRIVLSEITREINKLLLVDVTDLSLLQRDPVYYREEYAVLGERSVIPNSVQHNVPAWTIFAMFFIVIPFAGAMIREREDGSLSRLLTLPISILEILLSKVVVFLVICYFQFVLILLMGIYLFPLIHLPALYIGDAFLPLSILTLSISLAAIGYGIAIGTIARTHQQASIFASISVVILAALGGIWVPVFIMPPFLRQLSILSPLNWGLNGFYDILIRNAGIQEVIFYILGLFGFAVLCLIVATLYKRIYREG